MKIPYLKTFFKIEAVEDIYLPYFKGSTFRGVFGNTFKKIVCALKSQICNDCLLKYTCVYAYIFETPPPLDKSLLNFSNYRTIPHPFVIEPPLDKKRYFKYGEELVFSLILIGKARNYLPYFIYTFSECGKAGIGKGRGRFTLKEVYTENKKIFDNDGKNIIPPDGEIFEIKENIETENQNPQEEITIEIQTPLRIKSKNALVIKLEFHTLIKYLILRMTLLQFFHCDGEQPNWDHKKIIEIAKEVKTIEDNTQWWDWERYSARQQTKIKLGGIIGRIKYSGNIAPFKNLLIAGEIFHLGKNTSFGLGKYKIIET